MHKLKQSLVLLCFISLFISCKNENPQRRQIDEISVRLPKDPLKINPIFNPSSVAREIYQYLFLPLADFDPTTKKLTPILIEKIPEEKIIIEGPYKGDVSFDFRFKDKANWTDGSPITSKDYAFTVKSILLPNSATAGWKPLMSKIRKIELDPSDNKKVKVIVDGNYMLAKEIVLTIFILPEQMHDKNHVLADLTIAEILADKGTIEKDPGIIEFSNYFNSPAISRDSVHNNGPYTLTSWVTNQSLVLQRKSNYWGEGSELPFLKAGSERMIFKIIPDENTAITSLKNKDIDVMTFRSGANFNDLRQDKLFGSSFDFYTPSRFSYYYLGLNNRGPILQDKNVRQALAHLVDVDFLIDTVDYGNGTRTIGHFNPAKSYYASDIKPTEFNIEKAKTILESSGWKDTNNNGILDKTIDGNLRELELNMLTTGSNLTENIGILLKNAAKKAQVKINLEAKKSSLMRKENIGPRNYDIATLAISQDVAPDDPFTRWHSSMDVSGGNNVTGYKNEHADKLMEQIRNEKNEVARDKLYKQLQQIMFEDQPAIFLYSPKLMIAINKDFEATTSSTRPGYMANTFFQKATISN